MSSPEIFISAGEISGDLHGGRLLQALKRNCPDLRAFGIGGRRLVESGIEATAGIENLSLVGITEVLPRIVSILRLLSRTKRLLAERRPRAVVLIDSPDFNFPLARHASSLGIRVIYYISPTFWAWRRRRLEFVRRHVDLMLTILPFEEELYLKAGVRARYVGHPMIDLIRPPTDTDALLTELGLDASRPCIALLPGSRPNEVRTLLPRLLETGRILARRPGGVSFLVPAASPGLRKAVEPLLNEALPESRIVDGRADDCLAAARAAVVTSGTATLEAALVGTPFVTVYRLNYLSYLAGRLLVRTPHISLPNILLKEEVVTELIQGQCRPDRIAAAINLLLDDSGATVRMLDKFATMREILGPGGCAERTARCVAEEAGL